MRSLDKLGMTMWGIWGDSLLSGITGDPSTALRIDTVGYREFLSGFEDLQDSF